MRQHYYVLFGEEIALNGSILLEIHPCSNLCNILNGQGSLRLYTATDTDTEFNMSVRNIPVKADEKP